MLRELLAPLLTCHLEMTLHMLLMSVTVQKQIQLQTTSTGKVIKFVTGNINCHVQVLFSIFWIENFHFQHFQQLHLSLVMKIV